MLTRALEIYIAEFVGGIIVSKRSTDIENLNPDHVLSFNYSDTYEKIYGKEKKIKYNSITYNNLNVNPLDFNFPIILNLLENPHSH